ncbi:hypothetical protein AGMMS49579_13800 [Spirochaetia bacterium]|nr:hypothetical protein AGMMS49579_13800 [Spirochaetia bacterium]
MKRNLCGSLSKRIVFVYPLIFLSLVSCATMQAPSPYSPVYITDQAQYALLPPSNIDIPLDMAQQLTGRYGKQEFLLEAWVKADEGELTIALFNAMGADMGQLSFNDRGISLTSTVFPPALKPEYMAADFQFCFYRIDALASALKDSGLTLVTAANNNSGGSEEVRTIYFGKDRIIEILKTRDAVQYTNFLRDYSYTLRGAF